MCTFGEIVEPGSRNAWEDWDENVDSIQNELKWQGEIEIVQNIDTFLILEGRYLADSIKMQVDLKLQLINSVPEVNLKLYKTEEESNCYICVIKDYNLLLSSEIVELLKPFLTSSGDVIAIMTKPLVEYQVSELLAREYVIRSLSTKKPIMRSLGINFPRLEQPNIISGVSAGVICLRENLNLSGVAVVCYIEHPEEYQINELQVLLEKLNVVQIDSKPNNIINSNLYI